MTAVHATADDGEIVDIVGPHQGVVKMAVAKILILLERIRFRWVITARRPGDHSILVQKEPDITFEVNRRCHIRARWKNHVPAASSVTFLNGFVDREGVVRSAVACRAEFAHVKTGGAEFGQREIWWRTG